MKIDNSVQRHFLIHFLEISGLRGANIDVSTSYLLQALPTVESHFLRKSRIARHSSKNRIFFYFAKTSLLVT